MAEWLVFAAKPIIEWWGDRPLSDINGRNCRQYLAWRCAQPIRRFTKSEPKLVSSSTARHELGLLNASIRHYHREHGPLTAVPVVTMPPRKPPRSDYFLTRDEIAQRIRAARKRRETHHLVRLFQLGLYSGTRPGAMLKLRWLPSPDAGWIDVDRGVLHRKPSGAIQTTKRQPPCRIHTRLLRHLKHWQKEDIANGIVNVIHFAGRPIRDISQVWNTIRLIAGHERHDGPHILRHSSATMYMSWGLDIAEISGALGMSPKILIDVYGHHHVRFQERIATSSPWLSPRKRVNPRGT
jgi:integrase